MVKDIGKYIVKNIGFLAILGLAVTIAVSIIYWAILEILGLYGIREPFDSIDRTYVVCGITGFICGFIGVWHMKKKTDIFS